MSDLRARVIRLAHAKPSLRPHLLPLLKTARVFPTDEQSDVLINAGITFLDYTPFDNEVRIGEVQGNDLARLMKSFGFKWVPKDREWVIPTKKFEATADKWVKRLSQLRPLPRKPGRKEHDRSLLLEEERRRELEQDDDPDSDYLPLLKTASPSKIPYPNSIRLQSPRLIESLKETGKKEGWFGRRGSGQTAEDVVAIWLAGGPPNPDIVFVFKNNKTKEIMKEDLSVF